MIKKITHILILFAGILASDLALAVHADLDQAKKIDFAQRRIAMMQSTKAAKLQEINTIEKAINFLGKSKQDMAKLHVMGAHIAHLRKEIDKLNSEIFVAETSVKALIAKK